MGNVEDYRWIIVFKCVASTYLLPAVVVVVVIAAAAVLRILRSARARPNTGQRDTHTCLGGRQREDGNLLPHKYHKFVPKKLGKSRFQGTLLWQSSPEEIGQKEEKGARSGGFLGLRSSVSEEEEGQVSCG